MQFQHCEWKKYTPTYKHVQIADSVALHLPAIPALSVTAQDEVIHAMVSYFEKCEYQNKSQTHCEVQMKV